MSVKPNVIRHIDKENDVMSLHTRILESSQSHAALNGVVIQSNVIKRGAHLEAWRLRKGEV